MADRHKTVGALVGNVVQAAETYRRENEALQTMLLVRGLNKKQIRKEVNEYLKQKKSAESAESVWRKVCREMQDILRKYDPSAEILEKIQITGKPQ